MTNAIDLVALLSQTLESNAQLRRNAEAELKKMEHLTGYGATLLDLITGQQFSAPIILAAAVSLKNFVKENWNREKCVVEISNEDRTSLRMKALQSMLNTTGNVQKQLSQVVCVMGKQDFPSEWPELITILAENLSGTNLEKLVATLATLDDLCRHYRYEMKSAKLWQELLCVLQQVAAPLTTLFKSMVDCIPNSSSMPESQCQAWLEVTLLITKCFHSLSSQDLPEYFEDNLSYWMNGFMQLLKVKVSQLDANSDDSEANVLDKLKCCICEIVTLYSQRYEEEVMPFMVTASGNQEGSCLIETVWQLLVTVDSKARYDTLVNAALGFLSSICPRPQYAAIFQQDGMLKTMCEDIIIKNLMLRDCDCERFEDEPNDYIERDLEGSDIGTRRRGASDFLRSLCRQFESPIMSILTGVVGSFLQDCADNLALNWIKKDVVYCLISAIAIKTETVKYGATSISDLINVVDFYEAHVRSDLFDENVNALPIIKANALKYVVVFRNQLKPQQIIEVFGAFVKLLSSNYIILHQYVAYALERLILVKHKESNKVLVSSENVQIGPVIVALFGCFDASPKAQNSHYIMKAMMRCLNIIDAETAKSSSQIVDKLATMIGVAVKNPVDPKHLHFVFESLCVLLRQVYDVVEGGIDKYVVPLIENIFSSDAVEFIPYALQVTALLLDLAQAQKLKKGVSVVDNYLPFFENLLKEELWLRTANIPAALLVIESFMQSHGKYILDNYASSLLAVYQKLISSKALDQYGFQLANTFLLTINQNAVLTDASLFIPMLRRVQFSKTVKFVKNLVLFFAKFIIMRGAPEFYQAMDSIQVGMFSMVIEKVVVSELKNMHNSTTYDEKRICCIGFAKMLAEIPDKLQSFYGSLIEVLVQLVEASGCGPSPLNNEDAEEQNVFSNWESEHNDPYCKLSYAQHSSVIAAEVTNFKAYLAQAVMVCTDSLNAHSASCISEPVRNILANYAQS